MKQTVAAIEARTDSAIPHDAAMSKIVIRYAKPTVVAFAMANIRNTSVTKTTAAAAAAKLTLREILGPTGYEHTTEYAMPSPPGRAERAKRVWVRDRITESRLASPHPALRARPLPEGEGLTSKFQ